MQTALKRIARPVAYCEILPYNQAVLMRRMARGGLPFAPIWDDVRTLRGSDLPAVDLITGGFPCQDLSVAGKRAGLAGKRSGLFWEVVRLTEETDARRVFLENSWPGVRPYVGTIRAAFESRGFEVRDGVLAASDIGAPFRRLRWFMLAFAAGFRRNERRPESAGFERSSGLERDSSQMRVLAESRRLGSSDGEEQLHAREHHHSGDRGSMALALRIGLRDADQPGRRTRENREGAPRARGAPERGVDLAPLGEPSGARLEGWEGRFENWQKIAAARYASREEWPRGIPLPALPRSHDGLTFRRERIIGTGNAVVPDAAEAAYLILSGLK